LDVRPDDYSILSQKPPLLYGHGGRFTGTFPQHLSLNRRRAGTLVSNLEGSRLEPLALASDQKRDFAIPLMLIRGLAEGKELA
jgi:hypothetical protein